MPISLTNASASFQGYINKILTEKLDIFVIVYLDDILIYTNDDADDHVPAVWWVLEQLKKFLLFVNLKSVDFIKKRFGSLAMWYPQKASVWRTKELRQSNSGLSPSQYKISKYSSDLQTFIVDLSRD